MMDCKTLTNDILLDLHDRALLGESRRQAELHVASCTACRLRRDEISRLTLALRKQGAEPPESALKKRLDEAVLGPLVLQPQQQARRRRWIIAISSAAAAIAIASFAYFKLTPAAPAASDAGLVKSTPTTTPTSAPTPAPAPTPEPAPEVAPPAPQPPKEPEVAKETPLPLPEVKQPVPTPSPETPKPQDPPKPALVRGDLNGNGKLDREDLKLLDECLVTGRLYPLEIMDVNGDGVANCGDALALLQILELNP